MRVLNVKEFAVHFYPIGDNFHEMAASIMSSTSLNHKWGSSAVDLSGQWSMLAIASLRLNLPSQVVQLSELENLCSYFILAPTECTHIDTQCMHNPLTLLN